MIYKQNECGKAILMSLIPVLVEGRVKSGNFGHQEIRTAALFVLYDSRWRTVRLCCCIAHENKLIYLGNND